MNAATDHTLDIGTLEDIPVQGARRVHVGEHKIAVFRTSDNQLFALRDQCPHANGPLSQGIVHGNCVTCPLHNWVISLQSGQAQGADEGSVQTYPVQLNGDRVVLSVMPQDSAGS